MVASIWGNLWDVRKRKKIIIYHSVGISPHVYWPFLLPEIYYTASDIFQNLLLGSGMKENISLP